MARILAFIFIILTLAVRPAAAQVMKLGTLAPEGTPWHDVLVDMDTSWKSVSNNRTSLRVYPGGVLGDDEDMIRKLRIGQLQMAALTGTGLSRIANDIQALQMPMMLTSYEDLDCVRDRLAPRLEAKMEASGFKILGWADAGFVRLFATRPVVRPADLKPLKVFTWEGDPTYMEVMKILGFQPVPMAVTDILTGLQSGLIGAVPTIPGGALSQQWFGIARNMTDFRWAPLLGAVVISRAAWQAVPADLRPQLLRTARDVALRGRGKIRAFDDSSIADMKARGLLIRPVPADALAEWDALGRASYPLLADKAVPAVLVAEVQRLRDECRARPRAP